MRVTNLNKTGLIIGAVPLIFASFGTGWLVNDWRNGARIARLQLEGGNVAADLQREHVVYALGIGTECNFQAAREERGLTVE